MKKLIKALNIIIVLSLLFTLNFVQAETAQWDWEYPMDSIDGFILKLESAGNDPIIIPGISKELREQAVNDLIPGVTYSCTMFSIKEGVQSDPSIPFIYTKKPAAPDTLEYIEGRVNWNASLGLFDGYRIYYNIVNGDIQTIDVAADINSVLIDNFICGGVYEIYVVSLISGIESNPSEILTKQIPPCAPTNVILLFE